MTWKLTDWAKTRVGLVGVPWRDLTDEEFEAAEAIYPELRQRGYFIRIHTPFAPAAEEPTTYSRPTRQRRK